METTTVYCSNIGIMEKKMETTIMGYIIRGYIGDVLGLYRGCIGVILG